ncbi:response regulator [uncultured Methylibium sp.]|uniref:response regulator n=1 Tax=uncultured Methylibium sp. TaxID=381093 RepID=UPI0025FFA3FF|nr:response regulator [uncultured Methylibium sp.]
MSQRRTFIVEDSPVIRANLIDTLQELAPVTVVGWADSEADALHWLAEHPEGWDLLIVDLFLKQGSGLGVLRACRERPVHRKLVVFSNYATVDLRMKSLELRADAVFDKSNEIDALIAYCAALDGAPTGPGAIPG